jgi:hypothetical protein
MNNDIYKYIKKIYNDDTIIGRKIVNDIYEVLIDLNNPLPKEKLKNGISLVDDEKIRDTLIDLHNYAAMAIMLLDEDTSSLSKPHSQVTL